MIVPFVFAKESMENIEPGSLGFFKVICIFIISFISSFIFGFYAFEKFPYQEIKKESI